MFKFISLIFQAVFAYYLIKTTSAFDIAYEEQNILGTFYYSVYLIFWTLLAVANYIVAFGGTERPEIYVVEKNQKQDPSQENEEDQSGKMDRCQERDTT